MELSIREARARFSAAIAAATRGERVVVTKDGTPVVELVAVKERRGIDWEKVRRVRRELGLEGVQIELPDYFDDPAFSRRVLGLEE